MYLKPMCIHGIHDEIVLVIWLCDGVSPQPVIVFHPNTSWWVCILCSLGSHFTVEWHDHQAMIHFLVPFLCHNEEILSINILLRIAWFILFNSCLLRIIIPQIVTWPQVRDSFFSTEKCYKIIKQNWITRLIDHNSFCSIHVFIKICFSIIHIT